MEKTVFGTQERHSSDKCSEMSTGAVNWNILSAITNNAQGFSRDIAL